MPREGQKLGELLVEANIISQQQLEEILVKQKTDRRRLGTLLVEADYVNETQLTQILSQQLNAPWVSLYHIDFSRQLLNMVPREIAEEHCLIPIYVRPVRNQGNTLYVAMEDPSSAVALDACAQASGIPVRAMIAPPSDIRNAIRVYYGGRRSITTEASTPLPPEILSEDEPFLEALPYGTSSESISDELDPSISGEHVVVTIPTDLPPVTEILHTEGSASDPDEELPPIRDPYGSEASIEIVVPLEESGEIPITELALHEETPGPEAVLPHEEPLAPEPVPPPRTRLPSMSPDSRKSQPRMISLTLLDGTTIALPAQNKRSHHTVREEEAPPESDDGTQLTARDLISALRAVSHGADATEILGENTRWEKMFAALLSVLLRKHLIADWEFVEEFKKI
jgi:type IV pilus assembly protein PilB